MPTSFFGWIVFLVQQYHNSYLQGLVTTLTTSLSGTLLGCCVGFVVGMIQSIDYQKDRGALQNLLLAVPKAVCRVYVTVFRGTSMIV